MGRHKTDDVAEIKDPSGSTAAELPLSYRFNGMSFPILQQISPDGRTVTLTPKVDRARQAVTPHAQPIASDAENMVAQQNFVSNMGMGTTLGSVVGTAIGAILGLAVGVVAALVSRTALPACLATGLPVLTAFAGVGGAVGTVVGGGVELATAGWDYVQTLHDAPFTSHYESQVEQTAQHALQQTGPHPLRQAAQHIVPSPAR